MSLKYVGETALAENIAQEKLYIEGIRAALDAAKQDVIQVTSLGSATADKVGIAYQYMGTTIGSYKHGWFYEAVEVTPATDPATYTWQEFEFGGGLPYATTAPSNPEDGDVFVYIGATNLTYKKGSTYQYSIGTQFYAWGSGYDFTLSETPSVNDVLYNSTGEATPNYVVAYDSVNDAIEDNNGDTMARNSAKDKVMGTGWTLISPYNAGVALEVDNITNTLSTKIATNHSLGVVKGGSGTNIEANGEITVVNRLLERYEGAGAYIDYSNPIFLYTGETTADFTHGGIYEVTLTEVEPVGTENPSEEGWYEYYNDSTYAPTYDVTVDPQKTYYEATYTLLSSSGFTFNTDDFDVVDSEISLDATQRSFTGTQAEWDALTTAEKKTYGTVNITDDSDSTPEYYSTTETKTNKVWIDGKPIYRVVRHIWDTGNVPATGYSFSGTMLSGPLTNNAESLIKIVVLCKNTQGCWQELTGNGENGPAQNFVWFSDTSAYFIHSGVLDGAWAIFEYTKTTD